MWRSKDDIFIVRLVPEHIDLFVFRRQNLKGKRSQLHVDREIGLISIFLGKKPYQHDATSKQHVRQEQRRKTQCNVHNS